MKRQNVLRSLVLLGLALMAPAASVSLHADSVVVFNEIMYHPANNEAALEWVELRNQMAVDVDISNWTLENAIDYKFAEGTVIPGGGYLVVSVSPADLSAATGLSNAFGPFTGRLANAGEKIELRNNNHRLMDSLPYDVEGDWPVAANGAGPSLAKLDEDSASDIAENWRASEQMSGTPGARNFPSRKITVSTTKAVAMNSVWKYNRGDLGTAWRQTAYDDSSWGFGPALFYANATPPSETIAIPTLFSSGLDTNGLALGPGAGDPHYLLTLSAYSTPPPPAIPATVMLNHPAWLGNDGNSRWIGALSQGGSDLPVGSYHFRTAFNLAGFDPATAQIAFQIAVDNDLTNVVFNGARLGLTYSGFNALSSPFTLTSGFVPGTNTLDFLTSNGGTAPNPAGLRVKASGTANKLVATNTPVTAGAATYYFRQTFVLNGDPAAAALRLRAIVDDGAVFYLNGAEVLRLNLPSGAVTASTLAVTNVGNPGFTAWLDIPSGHFVPGTNVLAVELHQAASGTNDVMFGAEAMLMVTNIPRVLPTLAFNEMSSVTNSQFWVEILNYGTQDISLDRCVLARFGNTTNREYSIPSQTIPPGGYVVLDRALLGFGADPGDQVILYRPGKTNVIDAMIAKSFPRARFPEGVGPWLHPSETTPGASNRFVFHNEIVINEIMFHPRDLPAVPGVTFSNTLVSITNAWRYNQTGAEPAAGWSASGFDDSLWGNGKGIFYANISTLPAPKGTVLAISNGLQPVITYYFRTQFVFTNVTSGAQLKLNPVIDDGAVFYLNGVEVYRYGMADGVPTATTRAATNIGVPTWSGPVIIPANNLLVGTNILAVEVHQYLPPPGSKDVAFGAELTASGFVSPASPASSSPESWLELYNRSTNNVDLTGWRLSDGADYLFDPGTLVAPGEYLVVAHDVDYMRSNYPAVRVVGPMAAKLSKSGAQIVLKDAAANPANAVRYFDSDPWPDNADGFGASLELRDSHADNSKPEAWAASDESGRSQWQTITYRGIATVEPVASPTLWNEFVLGLLGEGEVLLDDISVIESPSGARRQLLQNGSFETGMNAWRIIGTHRHSEVITDPSNAANHTLRLVATGDAEHMHNHAETTLAFGASITNGMEYEISYRAKWLAGCNKLNTRLYFNRLPRTTDLSAPARGGTPGARNSRYVANLGPTYANLQHLPAVPIASESVSVSVEISDPDGVASATLKYSVNGGAWQSAPMSLASASAATVASAGIPAQATASVVQFYVLAIDRLGASSTYPSGGTNSRALYKVGDGQPLIPRLRTVRLVMTPADTYLLHASTNVMSNEMLGCTVITDEERVTYNASLHLQSSERGRDAPSRVGFTVRMPADKLFRGALDGFTLDRSGGQSGLGGVHDEILLKHAINKAGGLPGMYDDLVQLFAPRTSEDGNALMMLAKYGNTFLDSQYKNGGSGEMHKLELIYYPTTTVTGDPQSLKLPNPDLVMSTDIGDLGADPENYRWMFIKENHVSSDNYAPMIALAKAFSLTGTNLDTEIHRLMDVDEWMRGVAFLSLIGSDDMYTYGLSHNAIIYIRPEDQRGMLFLWDMDYSLVADVNKAFPGNGSANTYKIITSSPDNFRRYYNHLYDLSGVTGNTTYMSQWAARYAGLLGENWSGAVNYLSTRATFVRNQLPLTTAFAIANNGGRSFASASNRVTLTGSAPINVRDIEVNGLLMPLTWTSLTTWSLVVPLPAYTNQVVVRGLDNAGNRIANASSSITITNLAQPALLPVVINEWMADNAGPGGYPDPADGLFQDWFELYNPNAQSVDLTGYYLTDSILLPNQWAIPTNTVITARGFLLVWADSDGAQNGTGLNSDLHANFKLNNAGETIALFAPDGTLQHAVAFGPQWANISQGLFPDGNTNQFYFMTNWTPRASNRLGMPPSPSLTGPVLLPGGSISFVMPAAPSRAYRVDFKDDLNAANWIPLSTNRANANGVINVADQTNGQQQRYYRTVLLP